LKIKAVSTCETLAAICKTTRCHIWEQRNVHHHRHQNLICFDFLNAHLKANFPLNFAQQTSCFTTRTFSLLHWQGGSKCFKLSANDTNGAEVIRPAGGWVNWYSFFFHAAWLLMTAEKLWQYLLELKLISWVYTL